jgi:hypothetical protein
MPLLNICLPTYQTQYLLHSAHLFWLYDCLPSWIPNQYLFWISVWQHIQLNIYCTSILVVFLKTPSTLFWISVYQPIKLNTYCIFLLVFWLPPAYLPEYHLNISYQLNICLRASHSEYLLHNVHISPGCLTLPQYLLNISFVYLSATLSSYMYLLVAYISWLSGCLNFSLNVYLVKMRFQNIAVNVQILSFLFPESPFSHLWNTNKYLKRNRIGQ